MKADLNDITFLFLIRCDSILRLENILFVTNQLYKYFKTQVVVLEADKHNNRILKSLLNKNIKYQFVEDKDPILHKTRYFNSMIRSVQTPYIAIWDVDIVIDKEALLEAVTKLREGYVVYPYNGICYDVPEIIRSLFLQKKEIALLYEQTAKMNLLYNQRLVGGAILINLEDYKVAGGENEKHYGWGNDDFDRYYRFKGLGYKIFRVNRPLFHLYHSRGENSRFHNDLAQTISSQQRSIMENSSHDEILKHIADW